MTAIKISKHDVRMALDHFAHEGVSSPGLQRLRQQIGFGSLPRIKRLLSEIQQERIAPVLSGAKPVPDAIQGLINQIWLEFEQALAEREAAQDAETQNTIETMRLKVAEASGQATDLAAALARINQLQQASERQQHQLAAQKAELMGKAELITALQEAKQDMKSTLITAEQQATKREQDLRRKVDEAQTALIDMQKRLDKERESFANVLAELRDTVAYQQAENISREEQLQRIIDEKTTLLLDQDQDARR